jgi:hypothetical protein
MTDFFRFSCPACEKKFKSHRLTKPKNITCPDCSHTFTIHPDDEARIEPKESRGTAPPPLKKSPSDDLNWFIRDPAGQQFGPYEFNDLENYASQGRLSLENSIRHQVRTEGKWVSVTRIPELAGLMQDSAALQLQIAGAAAAIQKLANPDFPRGAAVPVLISAIGNILVGLFWIGTCFGAPLGIACIILCIFEFIFFANRESYNLEKFRTATLSLGIFEIIVGLFNLISFVCGIIVLIIRPSSTAIKN